VATATQVDRDMSFWAPETRLYSISDGSYLAVTVDPGVPTPEVEEVLDEALAALDAPSIASGKNLIQISPTVILPCTDEGFAIDLTPLHTFEPGTSHEDALTAAGYEVNA